MMLLYFVKYNQNTKTAKNICNCRLLVSKSEKIKISIGQKCVKNGKIWLKPAKFKTFVYKVIDETLLYLYTMKCL